MDEIDQLHLLRGAFYEMIRPRLTPPAGWKAGSFRLSLTRPHEQKVIEAWVNGPFAIHETIEGWRLSHIPTGLAVTSFATPELAAECADRIGRLADFSVVTEQFESGSKLYPLVRAIVDEIQERDVA